MADESNGTTVVTVPQQPKRPGDASPPAALDAPEFPLKSQDVPLPDLLAALPDTPSRDAFVKSLVDAETARRNFNQDYRLARMLALSGQFDDMKKLQPEQAVATAMVKVQLGRSWGLEPADAVRFIWFANGKPSLENEILASKMKDAGYAWDIEWLEEDVQHKGRTYQKCIGCRLWLKVWSDQAKAYVPLTDRNGNQVSESFTEHDADNALIYENNKTVPLSQKWNFKSWGRDMYYWRTISRVRKYHATNVLRGAIARAEAFDIPVDDETLDQLPPANETVESQATEQQPVTGEDKPSLRDQVLRQADLLDVTAPKQREYPD